MESVEHREDRAQFRGYRAHLHRRVPGHFPKVVFFVHFDTAVLRIEVQLGSDREWQYLHSVFCEPKLLRFVHV